MRRSPLSRPRAVRDTEEVQGEAGEITTGETQTLGAGSDQQQSSQQSQPSQQQQEQQQA